MQDVFFADLDDVSYGIYVLMNVCITDGDLYFYFFGFMYDGLYEMHSSLGCC